MKIGCTDRATRDVTKEHAQAPEWVKPFIESGAVTAPDGIFPAAFLNTQDAPTSRWNAVVYMKEGTNKIGQTEALPNVRDI